MAPLSQKSISANSSRSYPWSYAAFVTPLNDGNYYTDKFFFNCFRIAVILTLNTHTNNEMGTRVV